VDLLEGDALGVIGGDPVRIDELADRVGLELVGGLHPLRRLGPVAEVVDLELSLLSSVTRAVTLGTDSYAGMRFGISTGRQQLTRRPRDFDVGSFESYPAVTSLSFHTTRASLRLRAREMSS
jgi:hypothetical protein